MKLSGTKYVQYNNYSGCPVVAKIEGILCSSNNYNNNKNFIWIVPNSTVLTFNKVTVRNFIVYLI